MNDEKDEIKEYSIAGISNIINGGPIGDILYDINTNSIAINTGSSYQNIAMSTVNISPTPALTLKDGTVKIGEFEIEVEQLEACLKHLLKITKDANPEEFI